MNNIGKKVLEKKVSIKTVKTYKYVLLKASEPIDKALCFKSFNIPVKSDKESKDIAYDFLYTDYSGQYNKIVYAIWETNKDKQFDRVSRQNRFYLNLQIIKRVISIKPIKRGH